MLYNPEDIIGSTIVWINSDSTWKILGRTAQHHFLIEKVSGGWDSNRPGTKVDYPCGAILRGIDIGVIKLVSPSFEVLT